MEVSVERIGDDDSRCRGRDGLREMQSLGVELDEPRLRRSIGSRVRRVHQEGKVAGERPSNAMPKAAKATLAARISWTLPCEPGEEPGIDFDRRGRVVVGTVVRRILRNDEPSSP